MKQYPFLQLDKAKVRSNLKKMALKASDKRIKFRPHFKTHQSLEIGSWYQEFPIDGITVSSLKMAKYFAEDGWDSITIAFPFNILEVNEINKLASKTDLRVLAVDSNMIEKLDNNLTSELSVYIEIDPGYGRSGIHFNDYKNIENLISAVDSADKIKLHGFYSHAGHSYKCRSKNEIIQFSNPIIYSLSKLKSKYGLSFCFGDTPSCSVLEDFDAIDEISPGNFIFYDWIQSRIGSCKPEEIAIAMSCPVVAKYTSRNELLIHGGAVHFSKDHDTLENGEYYYGQIAETKDSGWGTPVEGCYLKSISQEHGIVKCSDKFFKNTKVGDILSVLPIHSCLTADLMGTYHTTEGGTISHLSDKIYK
ncbi:MAG: alanine racemase [Balneola sp.]